MSLIEQPALSDNADKASAVPITVLVADDKEAMLRVVRVLLRHDPEIHIVRQTRNYQQTTQTILDLKPQVVVMELHMLDESSISPQEIKSVLDTSGSELIAMSFCNDEDTQVLAKNLGAVTLLDKLRLVTELIPAIRAATIKHPSATGSQVRRSRTEAALDAHLARRSEGFTTVSKLKYPQWQTSYKVALLAPNGKKLEAKIHLAESKIFRRLETISADSNNQDERAAIADALNTLLCLQLGAANYPDWNPL